jgi:WD40 repeat protein
MLHRLDDKPHTRITESTYIRSILPMEHVDGAEHLLLTGSDDENIRVYDIEDTERGQPRLLGTVPGHAFQVSNLSVWSDGEKWEVLSTSFDQTIRRWTLSGETQMERELTLDLLHPKPIPEAEEPEEEDTNGGMTAEEARELEELMSDTD